MNRPSASPRPRDAALPPRELGVARERGTATSGGGAADGAGPRRPRSCVRARFARSMGTEIAQCGRGPARSSDAQLDPSRGAGCRFPPGSNDGWDESVRAGHERRRETMTDPKPRFIWYELLTSDPGAAEAFYRAVVGWKTADAGQPGMRYTILSAGDRGMGGLMAIPAEAARAGARPGWLGYVGVPDTDGAAKRIAEAGGAIHRGPDNIPG